MFLIVFEIDFFKSCVITYQSCFKFDDRLWKREGGENFEKNLISTSMLLVHFNVQHVSISYVLSEKYFF